MQIIITIMQIRMENVQQFCLMCIYPSTPFHNNFSSSFGVLTVEYPVICLLLEKSWGTNVFFVCFL